VRSIDLACCGNRVELLVGCVAGSEAAMDVFINDITPEQAAEMLRKAV